MSLKVVIYLDLNKHELSVKSLCDHLEFGTKYFPFR